MIHVARTTLLLLLLASSPCLAEPFNGWRGNGTGRWPDARPPLEWYRVPKGVIADLRAQPGRPSPRATDGLPLEKGIVRDWLVLGPFPVKDSVQDFGKAQLADVSLVQPALGDKVGDQAWQAMSAKLDDRWAFGPANAPFADVGTVVGYKPNQVAYAHAYLYTPKGGPFAPSWITCSA